MKNIHLQYKVISEIVEEIDGEEKTREEIAYGQAYVKAVDYVEALAKLEKFLGKKVKVELTQFADANAEIIG